MAFIKVCCDCDGMVNLSSPKNIHLHYKDARLFLCFPYTLPYKPPNVMLSPGGGMAITFGGSDKANTRTALDAWPKMLDFLKQNLNG